MNTYEIRITEQDKANAEWVLYHLRKWMPYAMKTGNVELLRNGIRVNIFDNEGNIKELTA